jgi:glycosyltransferase involved in cell wall biosynthesis
MWGFNYLLKKRNDKLYMKNRPFFSIIIPLYNKEQYIARVIDSVLKQSFKKFEIIVVNDGSTDDGLSAIKKIKDCRIRVINQKNLGASSARNTGIKNANAPYIAFLDADDEYLNDFLENIYKLTRKYKNIKFFAAAYKKIIRNKTTKLKRLGRKKDFIVKNFIRVVSKNNFFIHISSVVIHRNVFKRVGFFGIEEYFDKKTNSYGEDFDMWLRISLDFKLCFSNKHGCLYYRNTDSNISLDKKCGYNYKAYEKTLLNLMETVLPDEKKLLKKLYKRIALQYALTGNFANAEKMFCDKIKSDRIKKLINKMKIARRLSD